MGKKAALTVVAGALVVGMFPGSASAGQYCERADEVGAGGACRAALGLVIDMCSKVAETWGNECGLG